jgi:ABC-2 type transport system permease protein
MTMNALRVIYTIWYREFKLFIRERARIIGMLGQPLLYLLIVGQGIASGMTLNRTPASIDYLKFMYPGIIGMSVVFTSMFSAISIIWDREFGFLKEVLVAPVPRWGIAIGKVLGGATVVMCQSLILIALAPLVGISLSPAIMVQMLSLCFLVSFAMTSLGVLVAARMRSMQGFQMIMNFLVMPLYFLSGGMFPVSSAPGWMKMLMTLDPLTYGIDALRHVVFSGTVPVGTAEQSLAEIAQKAGLIRWDLSFDVAILAIVAGLLATVAACRFSTDRE